MDQPSSGPSNNLTIVAIPAEYSYAYKVSSEKVPHLTILHIDGSRDVKHIIDYVRHTVETSLTKFWLHIDRRGTLGKDDADVLFFDKEHAQLITKVRHYMLANERVKSAYDRIEQFPEWTPHLTLGYPNSPAKTTTNPQDEETWIEFDKIGIWTGNYEGVVIDLNPIPEGVVQYSMSDRAEDFFAHMGIKGMRWGVRKKSKTPVADHRSDDAKRSAAIRAKSKKTGVRSLSNQEISAYVQRLNMEKQFQQTTPSGKVQKFLTNFFVSTGSQQLSKLANDYVRTALDD